MSEIAKSITSEAELARPAQGSEDARELLARLYREIGVSAVSAALQIRDLPERADRAPARGEELAA